MTMKIEQEAIQKLKNQTKNNAAADDVFYLLAIRERTRGTLTLGALSQKMRQEGFHHTNDEYREVLGALAGAGIGTAVVNRVGNCVGVKDIKVNLADLGVAACTSARLAKARKEVAVLEVVAKKKTYGIDVKPINSLEISINGSPAVIQFPKGLSAGDLAELLKNISGIRH